MKNLILLMVVALVSSSCVSTKMYEDLKAQNKALKKENQELMARLDQAGGGNSSSGVLQNELDRLQAEKTALAMDLAASKSKYDRLKESYDALEANSSSSLAENLERNRKLLEQLEAKEKQLAAEALRLETLQNELADRSARVAELEAMIAANQARMNQLKAAISAALAQFEGNGLTVEQRDGKVYVSMENKLLFQSGSWAINSTGASAIQALGGVLAKNPQIAVLIEGHTDNVAYGGNGNIENNWDLSTKRATAVVQLLLNNKQIDPVNLTAAGKGPHAPVAENATAEGRSKNRRIEVILTPKLDQLAKMLEEI